MKHNKPFSIILCSTALILATPFLNAAETETTAVTESDRLRHETAGVVGGAVIGGVVGGPIGAVLTAAFGGWVSEQTLAKKENKVLASQLDAQEQELLAMQAEYRALQARYQVAIRESQTAEKRMQDLRESSALLGVAAGCCDDTEITLHFKTGSATIEPVYDAKLAEFAGHAEKYSKLAVLINGHADRRGDAGANMALSKARVNAVVDRLHALGMNNSTVKTSAFGEENPDSQEDTLENNFFDRRVVLKLVPATSGLLTQAAE